MAATAYAKGITGLAEYIGMDPKSARKLLRRVNIPRIVIPGPVRDTVLFKLTDIDQALAYYKQETAKERPGVDIDALVAEICG